MKILRNLAIVAAVVWAVPAFGQVNLNVNVQVLTGSNTIMVKAGETVNYQVIGTLTPDAGHLGLALFGFDLEFEGGPLTQANSWPDAPAPSGPPTSNTCTNVVRNFQKNQGITNPGGIGGTVIAGKLVQVGGGQNSIKNTADNAEFPVGSTITGVGRGAAANGAQQMCGPATLIQGSLTAPQAVGNYKLKATQVFANVIDAGQNGTEEFWATKAAGVGTITDLTVQVTSQIEFVSALPAATAGAGPNVNTIRVLSRTTKNEARLEFSGNLPAPEAGIVTVREMLADGAFGPDLAANFTPTLGDSATPGVDTARLILKDNGSNLVHKKWYQVESTGTWAGVGPFCLQFLVQAGDCNGDGNVNAADLTCVNSSVPTLVIPAAADGLFRKDINAAAGIGAADITAANGKIPSLLVQAPKPTGHTTCP